jgi:predicted MFS family arabinose efflux permease
MGTPTEHRLSTSAKIMVLVSMLALYFLAYFQRIGVPGTIFDEIQQDYQLSASSVTGLGAAFICVYAWTQLLVGMAADRFGGGRTLLFGSLIMTLGAFLFPLTHAMPTLYATRLLIGVGSSFIYLSIVKEVDVLFGSRHFASIMGGVIMVGFLGSIAATLPLERAVNAWGWRASFTGAAVVTALALLAAWFFLRHILKTPRNPVAFRPAGIWEVLRNPACRPFWVCCVINFPVLFVIQSTLGKKFLQDVAGLSSSTAATFMLWMAIVCGMAALSGGWALRLTGQRRKPVMVAATAMIFVAVVMLLAGVLFKAPGWFFLVAYLLLALVMVASSVNLAMVKELNLPEVIGVAAAVQNGMAYFGASLLGYFSGVILGLFRAQAHAGPRGIVYPPAAYATLFGVLAGLALLSLLVAIFRVPETSRRVITTEEIEHDIR